MAFDTRPLPGAMVISLDFELHWGVRDSRSADGDYRPALLAAREAVVATLQLFAEYNIAATWATVGFLFARDRDSLEAHWPDDRPSYHNRSLDAYAERVGADEREDPLHYAPSLINQIGQTPRQEIGTHTFSHYFCSEPGATPSTFRADLRAAKQIALESGVTLRSIVFPRNQAAADFLQVARAEGIENYRGNPTSRNWAVERGAQGREFSRRVGRMLEAYLPICDHTFAWDEILESDGLANVRASQILRPYRPRLAALEPLKLRQIASNLRYAARQQRLFHLWWHPHNFGQHLAKNLALLRRVLDEFSATRDRDGLVSLTMAEVADHVRSRVGMQPSSMSENAIPEFAK